MDIETAYIYIQDRLNKLATDSNQSISKRQFVYAFNKMQLHWFTNRVKVSEMDQDRQEELQQFIPPTLCLTPIKSKKENALVINIPEDYFYYKRVYGTECDCDVKVYAYPKTEGHVNRYESNEFYKPSLKWEETFFTPRNNKIYFYVDDFYCGKINLVYYRCPKEVDMEGIKYHNRTGVNADPEVSKTSLQEILDLTVQLLASDINDPRYSTISNHIQQNN